MTAIWILLFSLFILLGVEIRIRILLEQISEWKYGMDRFSEEIKNLKNDVALLLSEDIKNKRRFEL